MFLGRTDELNYLENHYNKAGSQMVVLYGCKLMGKTALIKEFIKNKDYIYYLARICSEKQQQMEWAMELSTDGYQLVKTPDYSDIFRTVTARESKKLVLVIDEFHNMIKVNDDFMQAIVNMIHAQWNSQPVMVILCSSAIGWVENTMVTKIGKAAYEISGFLKLKELNFSCIRQYFSQYSKEDVMNAYAILGGIPGLWGYFDHEKSIRDNIIQNILCSESFLHEEGSRQVSQELRESSVYHTILTSLAQGKHKLNDLYAHTGFSRAKISVYLKNLMELEIVEKINSFELEGKENTQKGMYRICNHFLFFWFRFLYPNSSKLELMNNEDFFDQYIEPGFKAYTGLFFSKVCVNYLMNLNKEKLAFNSKKYGEWLGKNGNIDIVAQDEPGNYMIGQCNFEKPLMQYEDYEWLIFCTKQAKVNPELVFLFSAGRFDEKLYLESKVKKNIHLVDFKEL